MKTPISKSAPPAGKMQQKKKHFEKMRATGINPHTGEPMEVWVVVPKADKKQAYKTFPQEQTCDDACDILNETTPDSPT
jgi:hypothetical protein